MSLSGLAEKKAADARASDHRWLILVVVSIAQLMVVLDATVVNIALPSAQARPWLSPMTTGSGSSPPTRLAFGSLLLLGGRLGDLVGRKYVVHHRLGRRSRLPRRSAARRRLVRGAGHRPHACRASSGRSWRPAALSTLVTTFHTPRDRGKRLRRVRLGRSRRRRRRPDSGRCADGIPLLALGNVRQCGLRCGRRRGGRRSCTWSTRRPPVRQRIDCPRNAVLASAGLFGLVFGFSHAESAGWTSNTTTAVSPGRSAWLLLVPPSSWLRAGWRSPLLPLRVDHRPSPGHRLPGRSASQASPCSGYSCS